ncbi:MAG: HAMP domain-containing histidine kinase [Aphanocapsa lilacina HA4352-LM1]|nr:HAMP domain-containing histidine kinase [Aphanocapsa lilacina HA4352-LM1]
MSLHPRALVPGTLWGRLTLAFVGLTAACLWGIGLVLGDALNNFFVQDAQARLDRQARGLAELAPSDWRAATRLSARQNQLQVLVFDARENTVASAQGLAGVHQVVVPRGIVRRTLTGQGQRGRLWVEGEPKYPWWLYSTAPVRTSGAIGAAVYVAMPLLRPRRFAQQVTGLAMLCVGGAMVLAVLAGLGLARTIAGPVQRLTRQARRLEAGDYQARCGLDGDDEIARLGLTLDAMAGRLEETIASLKAQEASRRELLANISHDLRTPLTAMRLSLEAVLDGVVNGEQVGGYLEKMRREAIYLGQLVDQLMLLARSDSSQLEVSLREVPIAALLGEALERIEPQAIARGVFLDGRWSGHLPAARLDAHLSAQVLANLLDNAVKYTPEGGSVILSARDTGGGAVQITVEDTGPGMDAQVLKRATERFWRADPARSGGGFGLGLAIAERLCRLQGVGLEIASAPGRGTAVILRLPVRCPDSAA